MADYESYKNTIRRLLKLLFYILPILVATVLFLIFSNEMTKKHVLDTEKDVRFFTKNLPICHKPTYYRKFDSDFVSYYSTCLRGDIKIHKTANGKNEIINRFGGKTIFNESPLTKQERQMYRYLTRDRQIYEKQYHGLSAYTILLTELKARECTHLATIDWKQIAPNFIGLEAAHLSPKHPYNGIDRLSYYILEDNDGEEYKGMDQGYVSRTSLTPMDAIKACSCFKSTCTFALKFK